MWKRLAPDEKSHENATYLRKCKLALQSDEGINNSDFIQFWKEEKQTNITNGASGLRDQMEMIIFSFAIYCSKQKTFWSMCMEKIATQICSLSDHLEQDIDELWIFFSSRLILVVRIGSLATSLHECNIVGSMKND